MLRRGAGGGARPQGSDSSLRARRRTRAAALPFQGFVHPECETDQWTSTKALDHAHSMQRSVPRAQVSWSGELFAQTSLVDDLASVYGTTARLERPTIDKERGC